MLPRGSLGRESSFIFPHGKCMRWNETKKTGCGMQAEQPAPGAGTGITPARTGPSLALGQAAFALRRLFSPNKESQRKTAPASRRSTFSAWFELSMTFDPRLNLVCNWWLYIESYEQPNRRNPMFSKQPEPRRGRLRAAHVSQPKHPAAFASSFLIQHLQSIFFIPPVSQAQNKTNSAMP